MFEVNGQMVNHAGQPVDEQGKVLVAEQPRQPNASEVDGLKRQVAELTAERDTAQRTVTQKQEVIDFGSAENARQRDDLHKLKAELEQAQIRITELEAAQLKAQEGSEPASPPAEPEQAAATPAKSGKK